jgi:hypothetical protein
LKSIFGDINNSFRFNEFNLSNEKKVERTSKTFRHFKLHLHVRFRSPVLLCGFWTPDKVVE